MPQRFHIEKLKLTIYQRSNELFLLHRSEARQIFFLPIDKPEYYTNFQSVNSIIPHNACITGGVDDG